MVFLNKTFNQLVFEWSSCVNVNEHPPSYVGSVHYILRASFSYLIELSGGKLLQEKVSNLFIFLFTVCFILYRCHLH